ncbi:unnamed protein product [Leptosia nina]|uniref:CRAL-TRIO domain-containing protein n=1 Tax=Leptosia nina TaxID=320188 RepID=A0AAV1IWU5_9NEOP
MVTVLQDEVLQFNADTLDSMRKEINLARPGEMEEAVNILKTWIQQQPHLKKKDFSDHYIEATILTAKGSVEQAKKQIDKICTMRTLVPQFFGITNLPEDIKNVLGVGSVVIMPKLNKLNQRIYVLQVHGPVTSSSQFLDFYRFGFVLGDYMKEHDYITSYQCVVDIRKANISDLVGYMNPMELRQVLTLIVECYGLRIKGIHLVSNSKLIDTFIGILKTLLKPKMVQRLQHHTDCSSLVEAIGKEYLPEDLGGTEPTIKETRARWTEVLYASKFLDYLREMNKATTDENCRPRHKFNEEYAGMPGTFRVLSVD